MGTPTAPAMVGAMGSAEGMAKALEGSSPTGFVMLYGFDSCSPAQRRRCTTPRSSGTWAPSTRSSKGRADVNGTCTSRWHGMSALHFACMQGHAAVARRLLDAGADADALDAQGSTAAQCAMRFGHDAAALLSTKD